MKDQRQGAAFYARARLLGGVAWLVLGVTATHAQSLTAVPAVPVGRRPAVRRRWRPPAITTRSSPADP